MCKTQLEQLVENTEAALVKEGASVYHLRIFKTVTNHLKRYAKEHNQAEFSLDFGIGFLEDFYSMRERIEKHTFPVIRLYCINEMDDFLKKGAVSVRYGKIPREYTIPAEFKQNYDSYLEYRTDMGIHCKTLVSDKLYLERFLNFLDKNGVKALEDISLDYVLEYIKELGKRYKKPTLYCNIHVVRYFLQFCFENGMIKRDISSAIPSIKYNRYSCLPSVYTSEEVKMILDAIDFGNPCGKRNYAIVLLLARCGLRAGDIADLRFSDIDWETQTISRIQQKTGNVLGLPLFNDVGEAIIDYLKNSRPESNSDHVFIQHKPPFTHFGGSAVGSMVNHLIWKAGLKTGKRKCGSHALRHSLASRLLENDVPLPVISEILGHTNTKTTMEYLRIDVERLRACALEVRV